MEIPEIDWPVPLKFLDRDGTSLAYRYSSGSNLTVVYTGGFHSNMNGEKASSVFMHAREQGFSALCLDYSGHGSSEGVFEEGNISIWLADTLHLVTELTEGPLVLVGSSMGGWIAQLTALRFTERVKGLVTIAAATDMTEKFIWSKCDDEYRQKLINDGYFEWDSPYDEDPYIITMQLIDDGRQHLLLGNEIQINCPVRLLHGTEDGDIDWQNSLATMGKMTSNDVHLKLIKGAGHRLSEPENIQEILKALDEVVKRASI